MFSVLVESALRSLVLGMAAWLAVKALRMRNPQAGQILWRLVLCAALSMPLLMQWQVLMLPAAAPQLLSIVRLDAAPIAAANRFDWRALALELYAIVAAMLCIRHAVGFVRMRRIREAATAAEGEWTLGEDIRASAVLRAPVSFGATILLPADHASWGVEKRAAVLAHERAHIANRDFAFQLLAQIHKALFWFSPLAWWLPRQLSLSSEQMSDDAAIRATGDRTAYAQLLMEFARGSECSPAAVAMARRATVAHRIERIVSDDELPRPLGAVRRVGIAVALACLAIGVASCSGDKREQAQPGAAAAPAQTVTPAMPGPEPSARPPLDEPILPANARLPRSNKEIPLSQPQYPPKSRHARQTGTVVLQLHVLEDGSVDDVRIKKSSSHARLDYAAANEALNWQLDPGTVDGKPQPMWGQFAVTFKLTD